MEHVKRRFCLASPKTTPINRSTGNWTSQHGKVDASMGYMQIEDWSGCRFLQVVVFLRYLFLWGCVSKQKQVYQAPGPTKPRVGRFTTFICMIRSLTVIICSAAKCRMNVGENKTKVKVYDLEWMRVGLVLFPIRFFPSLQPLRVLRQPPW